MEIDPRAHALTHLIEYPPSLTLNAGNEAMLTLALDASGVTAPYQLKAQRQRVGACAPRAANHSWLSRAWCGRTRVFALVSHWASMNRHATFRLRKARTGRGLGGIMRTRLVLWFVAVAILSPRLALATEFGSKGGPEPANIEQIAARLREDPYDLELLISFGTSKRGSAGHIALALRDDLAGCA